MKFTINSKILDKLKDKISLLVEEIKIAIKNNDMIILRHHADVDGFCAGLALENVILPLVNEKHGFKSRYYFRRSPCKAPFYELNDAARDIELIQGKALVIILDNGSGEEDLLAINVVKQNKAKVVVIDHHNPFPEIDKTVDIQINPHLVGGDSNICSGMLCYEIASQIGDVDKIFASLSGVADRCDGIEITQYLKGYSVDELKDIAICVDFMAHHTKHMDSKLIEDIMFDKKLVKILMKEINLKKKNTMKVVNKYAIVKDKTVELELDKISFRGEFPQAGKITGWTNDSFGDNITTFGVGNDFITFRSKNKNFNLHTLLKELKEKFPYANISGGGHNVAGTIRFVEAAKEKILEYVREFTK